MIKFKVVSSLVPINLLFIFLLLFSAFNSAVTAAEITDVALLVKAYSTSENSVTRRELLISLDNFLPQNGEKAPQWISDLLGNALYDKSPVVVAEAAHQIGQFKLSEYNSNLIKLYNEAEMKYGYCGYAERVQYAIIPALGKIGNKEAKAFISNLLKNDNGSQMGNFLLKAIKDLNDRALLGDLAKYVVKMDNLIKITREKGLDPLIYSRYVCYVQLAAEVEKSLLSKGGK